MRYAVGYDSQWYRDIGYGVPSICDHPECNTEIDRGLSYVCGGEPYGGEHGCGLFFCEEHLHLSMKKPQCCEKCVVQEDEIERDLCFEPKPDTQEWIQHKLTDKSWQQWRDDNPEEVKKLTGKPFISPFEVEV